MNDDQLERSLRSIGKGCFVAYFRQFADQELSNSAVVEILMRQEGYTESGSRTRVSQARRIIRSGRAKDALLNVIQSDRIPNHQQIAAEAREFLSIVTSGPFDSEGFPRAVAGERNMATTITLSPETEEKLDFLVSETGRSKEFFLHEMIERGMEDIEDYYLSIEVLERIRSGQERVYSSAEVRRDLGLDD